MCISYSSPSQKSSSSGISSDRNNGNNIPNVDLTGLQSQSIMPYVLDVPASLFISRMPCVYPIYITFFAAGVINYKGKLIEKSQLSSELYFLFEVGMELAALRANSFKAAGCAPMSFCAGFPSSKIKKVGIAETPSCCAISGNSSTSNLIKWISFNRPSAVSDNLNRIESLDVALSLALLLSRVGRRVREASAPRRLV
jgi:hypothetical protein